MAVQPPNRMTSAPTSLRLPQVEWNMSRSLLARPHRRLATAKLRREWLQQKYSNNALTPHMNQLHRSNTFTNSYERRDEFMAKNVQTKCFERVCGANNVWQNDIMCRNLPERIPLVRPVRVHTAPPRTILTDKHCSSIPLFQTVPGISKTDQEKESRRMHFIDKEWPSEKISWIRFNRNVPEIHRLGWIK